jgi:CO/xanthine dehydrogenase Mo-binding subunit
VSLPRVDLAGKATGPAFIHDLELPGMAHGRVVQPPARDRRIVGFDVHAFTQRCPDVTLVRNGSFLGLIAAREERAVRAADIAAGLVTWSDDTSGLTSWETASHSDASQAGVVFSRGEAPQSITGRRLATEIVRPYIAHASLAPSCAIAKGEGDRREVCTHSQSVQDLNTGHSLAFNIGPEKIVVIHSPGAGTYGHSGQDDVAYEAALLAREVTGTPVRVLWARAEDFALSPHGPGMRVSASATLDASGRIKAFDIESTGQAHVNRPGRGGTPNFIAGERLEARLPSSQPGDVGLERGGVLERNAIPLYAIPNVRASKRVLRDLPYRTSALRSLGGFANVFALETLMDDIAIETNADPVQLRLDHLENERAKAVIREAADMAGWPGTIKAGEGLGLGFAQYKNRSAYCAVVVRAAVDEHVRLTHAWSAVDVGEVVNPDGVINQIEGAIIQSASWTLHEQIAFEGDAIATRDWASYPVLKFSEVPEIRVSIIERPEEPPLGVGEAATAPTAAAIGNAVRRALGVRIRRLPITREAILDAIG